VFRKNGTLARSSDSCSEKLLTTVLADGAPKGRNQGGSVIKDAVDVGRAGVDRSAEQINISRLAVDRLTVTQDAEKRLGRHRRAGGEGDGWVNNRDRPGLGMMQTRGREGGGQRRRGGGVRRRRTRRIIGDTLWENLDGHYGPGGILIIISRSRIRLCRRARTAMSSVLEGEATVGEVLEYYGGKYKSDKTGGKRVRG